MKNVLLFIYRNHVFFVFLLLELISFTLIVRNGKFHGGSFFNSSNQMVGTVYSWNNSVTEYLKLKRVNDDLALENAALRQLLTQSKHSSARGSVEVEDSIHLQKYTYVPGKVVSNSVNRRNNYLTIDKGTLNGVTSEMAVISSQGIVGIVKDVSKNYASVMSLLHKNSSISARIIANGYFGSIVWDGKDPHVVQLNDIPSHVKLEEGMIVETSGYSSMFPKGISVGHIESFDIGSGDNFYAIDVRLSTDLNATSVVYVVNNLMKLEQRQLEIESQKDDE